MRGGHASLGHLEDPRLKIAMKSKTPAKSKSAKSPKFERIWNDSSFNPNNSPYWEPPTIGAELLYVGLCYMDKKGTPIKDEYLFNRSKVQIRGEFERLGIDDKGLVKDLETAIDEVIKNHIKSKTHKSQTRLAQIPNAKDEGH